jgi:hypothetical protein
MGNEAAYLNSKDEVFRCRFPPGSESLLRREMVKTIVKLYSVKLLDIKL